SVRRDAARLLLFPGGTPKNVVQDETYGIARKRQGRRTGRGDAGRRGGALLLGQSAWSQISRFLGIAAGISRPTETSRSRTGSRAGVVGAGRGRSCSQDGRVSRAPCSGGCTY